MTELRALSDVEIHLLDTIQHVKAGRVEVMIQDARIVQIDRSEATQPALRKTTRCFYHNAPTTQPHH
jgi:hypothetical protein